MTQSTAFEQMIASMRDRLRPNSTRLFADWLRMYVGLSCRETSSESRLLRKLLQELSQGEGEPSRTQETWRACSADQEPNRKSA
jgi:hypothetical protein